MSGKREGDQCDDLIDVPFPFFRLPFERRERIYGEIFQTTRQDNIIIPDPSQYRRRNDEWFTDLADRIINYGLSILLSCQQAHVEGAKILYGSNTFHFDDTKHGRYTAYVEGSRFCYYCTRVRENTKLYDNASDRCYGGSGYKHHVQIPYCDFVSMEGKQPSLCSACLFFYLITD